jgi:protein SCO1/2
MQRRLFLAGAAALGAARRPVPAAAAPTQASRLPNLPLETHDGRQVRFYDDLLKGRTVTINFMYTLCGDICPGMTQNLVEVQRLLGDRVGRDIFMYSLSLQPEYDTPAVLRDYAEGFGVGPGWLFLTGAPGDVETLRRRLGFTDPDPVLDADPEQHIGVLKYGIEPLDRWGGCPALSRPEQIVRLIGWLENAPGRAAER